MARGVFTRGGWGVFLVPLVVAAVLIVLAVWFGRGTGETPTPTIPPFAQAVLTVERLPVIVGGHYELWERRGSGGEQRLGAFRVLEGGTLTELSGEPLTSFPLAELPPGGTELIVTVEAGDLPSGERSERVFLRGVLGTTEAELRSVLPKISGKQRALLATPTDDEAPDTAGLWFAKSPGSRAASPEPGLTLPVPSPGWVYGGWVVTGAGTTLSTGLFGDPGASDVTSPRYSVEVSSETPWDIPGEDFLSDPPEGVKFPLNLADGRAEAIVSLEPDFGDDGERLLPFLSLLSARIPYKQQERKPFELTPVDAETFPRANLHIEPLPAGR